MFLRYIILFIVCINGLPISDDNGDAEDDDTSTPGTNLGDGIKFSWTFAGSGFIIMNIEMPVDFNWIAIGFHKEPYSGVSAAQDLAEDLALITIKHRASRIKLSLKSVHLSKQTKLLYSEESSYAWEKKMKANNVYIFSISREIGDLPIDKPLKLIWAYGTQTGYRRINAAFQKQMKSTTVTLNQPSLFVSRTMEPVAEESLTVPITETPSATGSSSPSLPASTIVTEPSPTTEIKATTTFKVPADKSIVSTMNNNAFKTAKPTTAVSAVHPVTKSTAAAVVVPIGSTPCPTKKCNCANYIVKHSHWYDILKEKENTVYIALIGASALLTGLLVLCIACCCARRTRRIPRTKKHKVAFYKVDDFDSDADDEVEFLTEKDVH